MEIKVFNKKNSIYNTFLAELRDKSIQKDPMRFRRNIERMGEIMAYEISKSFHYDAKPVETPLGVANESLPVEQPVVASVLRAGLPLHIGFTNYFDRSENAFVSAYRIEKPDGQLEFKIEYNACPNIDGKTLILVDPMLATGNSMWLAYQALLPHGTPSQIHIAAIIGSQQGVDFVDEKFPPNTNLWIGAVDSILNEQSYIVPGLGDAGDLCYGLKE